MKKCFLLIVFIPFLTFSQANKYVRQGLRTKDFKKQDSLFSLAIKEDPKHLDAYFYRGLALFNLGEYNHSILDFTKVIFYKPDADSYYNRGNAKFNLGNLENAANDYEKAIELDPYLIDAHSNLGTTRLFLEDYENAIEALDEAILLHPNNQSAYLHRAKAHMKLQNYKLAFKDFRYNILLNQSSHSYLERGLAFFQLKYFKEARNDFSKALRKDRKYIPVYFHLGAAHLFLEEYTLAISTFSLLVNRDDMDAESHLGLALAYIKTSQDKLAKIHFQKAKNILLIKTNYNIESFENTYWYQNQKPYFNESLEALMKL